MANISITLGGGFDHHMVTIALNDRTILEEESVTSSPLTDHAAELAAVPATASESDLSVRISGPGAEASSTASCTFATRRDRYVVIYLDRSAGSAPAIRFVLGDEPFGFG